MDEPTTGLDPNQIVEIRELIQAIGKEKTVLLSTHIMQEVQAMCSRVIVINRGKLVADSPLEELRPADQIQDILLVSFEEPVSPSWFHSLDGIDSLELIDERTCQIKSARVQALKQEIMKKAIGENRIINQLLSQGQSLEDVFRSLTREAS